MTTWKLLKVEKETEPKCWHCQTNIKWACWIESSDGEVICVGRSCCENFLSRKDLKMVKTRCETIAKVQKIKNKLEMFAGETEKVKANFVHLHLGADKTREFFPELFEVLIRA